MLVVASVVDGVARVHAPCRSIQTSQVTSCEQRSTLKAANLRGRSRQLVEEEGNPN